MPKTKHIARRYCLLRGLIPSQGKVVSACIISDTKGGYNMKEDEKKLVQAKHRLEEAQARDRVKERKARTRRLIQEGALLEKAFPAVTGMELNELEDVLREHFNNGSGAFWETGALRFFFIPKGALSEIFNYPRRILKSTDMKGFQRYFLG